jgi:two-component system chemotaxis sensor kinase CheA
MDVVHTVVDQLGGTISLKSKVGEGTQVTLSLPLSAAVSRVMTFEVCGQEFGLPIDSVVETMRLSLEEVAHIKQHATFLWRDRTLPLVHLGDLLQLEHSDGEEEQEVAVLVVKHYGERVGLVVNDFQEGIDVILKPMEGVLGDLQGYAGTALLGDGSVLLVLNLRELL